MSSRSGVLTDKPARASLLSFDTDSYSTLEKISLVSIFPFVVLADSVDTLAPIVIWTMVEAHITVACSALVGCMPVITHLVPERLSTRLKWYFSERHTAGANLPRLTGRNPTVDSDSRAALRHNRVETALQDRGSGEGSYAL